MPTQGAEPILAVSEMPKWHQFMAPVLQVLSDGSERTNRQLCTLVADHVGLNEEQRSEVLASGTLRYHDRVSWAVAFLKQAGALERPARGRYLISASGRALLAAHPGGITEKDLEQLEAYQHAWQARAHGRAVISADIQTDSGDFSPVEQIEAGIDRIDREVAADLLMRLHAQEPAFFEQAVVDLVLAMGYGGGDAEGMRTQLSNDGGIDGIVNQDILGLSRVYIQAKRYALDKAVQRPEIQAFVGALHGVQANQGVFITTGRYTSGAIDYANSIATRVILIDGSRLAELMIKYRVGVQTRSTYSLIEIDEDFFA